MPAGAQAHSGVVPEHSQVPQVLVEPSQYWSALLQQFDPHLIWPVLQVTPQTPLVQVWPVGQELALHWQTAVPPWLTHKGVVPEQVLVAQGSEEFTQRCEAPQTLGLGQEVEVHLHRPSARSQVSPVPHEVELHWQTAVPPWFTHSGVVPLQFLVAQGSPVATQRRVALQTWPVGQLVPVHLHSPSEASQVSPVLQVTPWHLSTAWQAPLTQLWPAPQEVALHWQIAVPPWFTQTGVVPEQFLVAHGSPLGTHRSEALHT